MRKLSRERQRPIVACMYWITWAKPFEVISVIFWLPYKGRISQSEYQAALIYLWREVEQPHDGIGLHPCKGGRKTSYCWLWIGEMQQGFLLIPASCQWDCQQCCWHTFPLLFSPFWQAKVQGPCLGTRVSCLRWLRVGHHTNRYLESYQWCHQLRLGWLCCWGMKS